MGIFKYKLLFKLRMNPLTELLDAIKILNHHEPANKWVFLGRTSYREDYRLKPGQEMPEIFRKDLKDGDPVEDAFSYNLQLPKGRINFGRLHNKGTHPPIYTPYLYFDVGKSANPENADSAMFAESYSEVALRISLTHLPKFPVDVHSQNLGLYKDAEKWPRKRIFTEKGRIFIRNLIKIWRKLPRISGLDYKDKQLLEKIIAETEEAVKSNKLIPMGWFHT